MPPPLALLLGVAAAARPKLAPIGPAEIFWNKTRDHCCLDSGACTNWARHVGEQPDSMPAAWHDPLTNTSFIIAATSWGTWPTVGPSLGELKKHDCSRMVYTAVNNSHPDSFANHQWLQTVRVFPNGSGVALIHNEFHGETICRQGDCTYCSTTTGKLPGDPHKHCIQWSTDLGATTDGGATWHATHSPLFTSPRRYTKDQVMEGYGALGSILVDDGWFYGHVAHVKTGGEGGYCVWRTRTLADPDSYRGWNGTEWSTRWVNPWNTTVPPSEMWKHECAFASNTDASKHPNPKQLSHTVLAARPDWPKHVMVGWPEGKHNVFSYAFPEPDAAPFTAWDQASFVDIADWMDPHVFGDPLMYPTMLDHDSPFSLADAQGGEEEAATALSYGLLGNRSMHLYFVVARSYLARIPVAWFDEGAEVPKGPFPPLPPNTPSCGALKVSGAGLEGIDGTYSLVADKQHNNRTYYSKDADHQLYCSGSTAAPCRWTIAHYGHPPTFYEGPSSNHGLAPPPEGWIVGPGQAGVPPVPTVTCA